MYIYINERKQLDIMIKIFKLQGYGCVFDESIIQNLPNIPLTSTQNKVTHLPNTLDDFPSDDDIYIYSTQENNQQPPSKSQERNSYPNQNDLSNLHDHQHQQQFEESYSQGNKQHSCSMDNNTDTHNNDKNHSYSNDYNDTHDTLENQDYSKDYNDTNNDTKNCNYSKDYNDTNNDTKNYNYSKDYNERFNHDINHDYSNDYNGDNDNHDSFGNAFDEQFNANEDCDIIHIPKQSESPCYSWSSEVEEALLTVFGLEEFRENQSSAINATLSGKDVFVLMVKRKDDPNLINNFSPLEVEKVCVINYHPFVVVELLAVLLSLYHHFYH